MNQVSVRFVVSCIFIFLIAAPLPSLACGPTSSTDDDLGYLVMNYEKVPWPSPESVLRNLRSNEYETFDHALALVGVPQTPEAASFDPPQDAELRYAGWNSTSNHRCATRLDALRCGCRACWWPMAAHRRVFVLVQIRVRRPAWRFHSHTSRSRRWAGTRTACKRRWNWCLFATAGALSLLSGRATPRLYFRESSSVV